MWIYGVSGLVLGFIAGMGVNIYLLQGVPRADFLKNKSLRRNYGLLNWGIALLGMVIGLAVGQSGI